MHFGKVTKAKLVCTGNMGSASLLSKHRPFQKLLLQTGVTRKCKFFCAIPHQQNTCADERGNCSSCEVHKGIYRGSDMHGTDCSFVESEIFHICAVHSCPNTHQIENQIPFPPAFDHFHRPAAYATQETDRARIGGLGFAGGPAHAQSDRSCSCQQSSMVTHRRRM